MRKTYTLSNFAPDFFDALDDFLGMYPSVYTLKYSFASNIRVYHAIKDNLDLIFYNFINTNSIVLLVTTDYDSSKEVWYQKEVVNLGYEYKSDPVIINKKQVGEEEYCTYHIPAPTLSFGEKMVVNYKEDKNLLLISVIKDMNYVYGGYTHTAKRTMNLFFGHVDKYTDFDGGFLYGGDSVYMYNRVYHTSVNYKPYSSSYVGDSITWNYSSGHKFDCILRCDIDDAPIREKESFVKADPKMSQMPLIKRSKIWAVTLDTDFYIPMVCSISNYKKTLPSYEPLMGNSVIDVGHTVNTLNNIAPIFRLWLMVRRDPEVLNNYSAIAYSDVLNFVNMYNMRTDKIINGTYPVKENVYNCFNMGYRRNMVGMLGYPGLAFLLYEDNSEDVSTPVEPDTQDTDLELLDLDAMESHKIGGQDILNIRYGGKKGYGGDTNFDNMSKGSFILKRPYTDFSSLTFTFCDDSGYDVDTVTLTKSQLDNAFSGSSNFNLLPVGSPVEWLGDPGEWSIKPFSDGSTSTVFLCSYQNCGLVGVKGNL